MFIVQLSDLHLKAGRALAFNAADSAAALEKTVAHLCTFPEKPACIVITGDVAEQGEAEAYVLARELLSPLGVPLYLVPGNHDEREILSRELGEFCPRDPAILPYCCYTKDFGPLRLIFLDGAEAGAHSGQLHERVARWLEKNLAAEKGKSTLLFTHHPPFLSGFGLMDEPYINKEEFARIIRANPQTRLCCGHLHTGFVTLWEGVPALCAPPLVMHMEMELRPDGGDRFSLAAPGYVLHHYIEGRINSHFRSVPGNWPQAGPYSFSHPPQL